MGPGDSEIVNEERVTALLQNFSSAFREVVPQVFEEFGQEKTQEFIDELKYRIQAQLFDHAPLQHNYYLGKLRLKLDPRILIATGAYLNGMVAERVEGDTSGISYRAGMQHGLHAPSGLTLAALQQYLENGTSRMPARPHWRPMSILFRSRANDMSRDLRSRIASRVRARMQA